MLSTGRAGGWGWGGQADANFLLKPKRINLGDLAYPSGAGRISLWFLFGLLQGQRSSLLDNQGMAAHLALRGDHPAPMVAGRNPQGCCKPPLNGDAGVRGGGCPPPGR